MQAKTSWTIQSFILCFFFNALLIAAVFLMAKEILWGVHHQYLNPLLEMQAQELPESVRGALENLRELVVQTQFYMPYALGILGGGFTFLLWILVQFQGRRLLARVQRRAARPAKEAPEPAREEKAQEKEAPMPEAQHRYAQPSPGLAVQMLSILQRKGRFIDFLQEDLSLYDDAQVGAAVRNIHEGCKAAVYEHIELEPIFKEDEGTGVDVQSGFDSNAIRLTGNVTGNPPFHGVLRHRGWRVAHIELPQSTFDREEKWIVAPAEVELQG